MSLPGARVGMMAGKRLPYDARVEYIGSWQAYKTWMDTGCIATGSTRLVVDCSFPSIGSQNPRMGQAIPGAQFNFGRTSAVTSTFRAAVGGGSGSLPTIISTVDVDTNRHTFEIDARPPCAFKIDGVSFSNNNSTAITPSTKTFTLFAVRGSSNTTPVTASTINDVYVWGAKIYDGDTLLHDWIPVRVGQEGRLYDQADPTSGPLGNGIWAPQPDATGTWSVGPDISSP